MFQNMITPVQGGVSETELWSNQDASLDFTGEVTLSESYSNYKFIDVYFKGATSDADSLSVSIRVLTSDMDKGSSVKCRFSLLSLISGNYYFRPYRGNPTSTDKTKMYFYDCYKWTDSSVNNGYSIPIKIVGIK